MTPEEFTALEVVASEHFGVMTFVPLATDPDEVGAGTENAQLFNPTALDIDGYLDWAVSIGARGAFITTKHCDGFCLWASDVAPERSVQTTAWYRLNGEIDVLAAFVAGCRARNLAVGFYFAVGDNYQKTVFGSWSAAGLLTTLLAQLTELLDGTFGDIDFIFLDAWGSYWGALSFPTFVDIPYLTIYNHCKTLQADCLVLVNNHDATYGDVRIWEVPVDGLPSASGAAFVHMPMHDSLNYSTAKWFAHSDTTALSTTGGPQVIAGQQGRILKLAATCVHNFSQGPTGGLSANLTTVMEQLKDRQPVLPLLINDVMTIDYTDALGDSLESRTSRDGLVWTKTFGTSAAINPQGELWNAGSGQYIGQVAGLTNDYCVDIDFKFLSLPTSFTVAAMLCADAAATYEFRFEATRSGSNFYLAISRNEIAGGLTLLDSNGAFTVAIDTSAEYRLTFRKVGTLLRGQLWENGIKIATVVTDGGGTLEGLGYPGFILNESAASATTGLHVTRVRVYSEQYTAPLPPTLLTARRTSTGVALEWNSPDVVRCVRVYRSEVGGDFALVKDVTAESYVDTSAVAGTAYLYYLTAQDESFNESDPSNTLSIVSGAVPSLEDMTSAVSSMVAQIAAAQTGDATLVDQKHTFSFSRSDQLVADYVIREIVGFDALLAMEFGDVIHPRDSLASALVSVLTPSTGMEITEPDILPLHTDRVTVHIPAIITAAGTYTLVIKATTDDGQEFLRRGIVIAQTPTGT